MHRDIVPYTAGKAQRIWLAQSTLPILALESIFRFLEKLSDRAAARAVVMRLDWNYALRQELTWTEFHYSDSCDFPKRLLEHGREWVVFERLVAYLRERGYIKGRGKQRTDATKILGLVTRLSRLELVWETIRVALGPWYVRMRPG